MKSTSGNSGTTRDARPARNPSSPKKSEPRKDPSRSQADGRSAVRPDDSVDTDEQLYARDDDDEFEDDDFEDQPPSKNPNRLTH